MLRTPLLLTVPLLAGTLAVSGFGRASEPDANPYDTGSQSFPGVTIPARDYGDLNRPSDADRPSVHDRRGVPDWEIEPEFADDVFTFVRLEYDCVSGWKRWATDYPDSDLNFSYRLQQLTSIPTDPDGRVLRIEDPDLFRYPFVYMVEPGGLKLSDVEAETLRRYLDRGGFLMVDDFWGEYEWDQFAAQLAKVFPDREPVDLPLEHPIFHIVYDLQAKPQVPSIGVAQWGKADGVTWERDDAKEPHYRAILDDAGRVMVMICHNTDLGDGWEREGEDAWYFREFSEKRAYPIGINIVVYALTH